MMIILRKSNSIISRLICWFTEEEWSHIGYLSEGKVYHADFLGARCESKEVFLKGRRWEIQNYRTTISDNNAMLIRAKENTKKAYDFPLIFAFIIHFGLKKLGIASKIPLINPRWRVCSEYVHKIVYGSDASLTPGEMVAKLTLSHKLVSKVRGGKL